MGVCGQRGCTFPLHLSQVALSCAALQSARSSPLNMDDRSAAISLMREIRQRTLSAILTIQTLVMYSAFLPLILAYAYAYFCLKSVSHVIAEFFFSRLGGRKMVNVTIKRNDFSIVLFENEMWF